MNKMLKTFILTGCLALTAQIHAEDKDPQAIQKENQERWSKLMNLINREIQTIKNNKYSGADLKHRLFELYSEKIKLIREKETQNLLKADPKDVAGKGKDSYFKNSREQYQTAQKYALSLIPQYPNYERISEIYYAMAINSRDFGSAEDTEKFLKMAIKTSKENNKTMYNAKTALAEYYYNNKKYNEAISYYNDILKNQDNEWFGKHLYNASWCHLKERNFKKALELIKESFETTKNKKYVSMKEQINQAIGIFFVQADATREGIEFYERNTTPSSPWLLMLASSSMNKNNFSITEDVLRAALKDTKNRKNANDEMKVRLAQLDIYRESKKDDLYFETANNILDLSKKNKLDKDDVFSAMNKIKEVAGFMQINLVKDKNADEVKYSKEDYKKIMRYFDILAVLDKPNKNLYRYYQGETALSTHDFKTALKFYVRSVMNSKINKDAGETTKKSLEAMLSTLELAKLEKKKEDEYTIFAFKNYVIFYPKSEKSQVIYQKLFSKYFEQHVTKKAVNILLVYKKHYPEDEKIHREMLTQILDTYIKEKNTDKLAFWVRRIEKGYLNYSKDYIENSIAILGGLLFDKYQALEKQGKMKEAMNGYESIYESKQYPNRIKAEAAYAIATLHQDQNKAKDSYKWLRKSLDIYDNKDLIKVTPSLLVLAKGYRLLQNFEVSTELAANISKRFCDQAFKEKDGFYELVLQNNAIEQTEAKKLLSLEDSYKDCKIEKRFLEKNQLDNMEQLILSDKLKEVTAYFEVHSDNDKLARLVGRYMRFKFWQAPSKDKESMKKMIIAMNEKTPAMNLNNLFDQYDHVMEFREKILNQKFVFTSLPKFDEDKYNSEIEQYFNIIQELNKEAVRLSKDSLPEEIILIREVLALPYFSLVDAINGFTPQGVDNKYLEGFRGGMRQITESLLAKGLQVDREKTAYLEKNNYFFEVQKHDKFENIKAMSEEKIAEKNLQDSLNFHSALLFTNTLDLSKGQRK